MELQIRIQDGTVYTSFPIVASNGFSSANLTLEDIVESGHPLGVEIRKGTSFEIIKQDLNHRIDRCKPKNRKEYLELVYQAIDIINVPF